MLIEDIKKFSKETNSNFDFDYDLKKCNWFNIGGKTKVYFKPESLSNLVIFLKTFGAKEKIFILGAGSNILINDNIFNGIVNVLFIGWNTTLHILIAHGAKIGKPSKPSFLQRQESEID